MKDDSIRARMGTIRDMQRMMARRPPIPGPPGPAGQPGPQGVKGDTGAAGAGEETVL